MQIPSKMVSKFGALSSTHPPTQNLTLLPPEPQFSRISFNISVQEKGEVTGQQTKWQTCE